MADKGFARTKKRFPKGPVRFGKRGGAFESTRSGGMRRHPDLSRHEQKKRMEEADQEIPKAEKGFQKFLGKEQPGSEQALQESGAFQKGNPGQVLRDAYAKMLIAKATHGAGVKGINMPKVVRDAYMRGTALVKTYARTAGYLAKRRTEILREAIEKMGGEPMPPAEGSGGKKYPLIKVKGKVFCGHPIVQGWGAYFTPDCKHVPQEQQDSVDEDEDEDDEKFPSKKGKKKESESQPEEEEE